MKKLTILALFFLVLGIISACSKGQPTNAGGGDGGNATTGDKVFQQSCISCHSSGDLTGGQIKLDSSTIHNDFKSEADLSKFVSSNMPRSAPGSLSKKEYDAVVKYLWNQ